MEGIHDHVGASGAGAAPPAGVSGIITPRHTGIHGTTPKLPMPAGAPPHTPVVPAAILRGAGFAPAPRAIGGSKTTTGLVRATGSGAGGGGPALAHAVGGAGARGAHEAQRGVLGARPVGASHRGWTPPRSLVPTPLGDMGAHGQRPPPVPYQPLGTRPLVPGGHAAAMMPLSAHGIARAYDPAAMIAEQKKMEEQRRKAEEQRRMQQELDEDAVVGEAEEADTFSTYAPSKMPLGKPHPDPVVETSALGSVPPPDLAGVVRIALPRETIERGLLSNLQLESIAYANRRFQQTLPDGSRGGFFLGDGAGMGKGRQIAGIIFEAYRRGCTKAVWCSVSEDLKQDALRDFADIGAGGIPLHLLKDCKAGDTIDRKYTDGVFFSTYACLVSTSRKKGGLGRVDQLIDWIKRSGSTDCVLVFDECHKAKNTSEKEGKGSLTAICVTKIQAELPQARVVYVSATGASALKNLGYMWRLGMWGPGTAFEQGPKEFQSKVGKKGDGAMEMVSMDMKAKGMFLARSLSYEGAEYSIQPLTLSDEFRAKYDHSCVVFATILSELGKIPESKASKRALTTFWGMQLSFFRELCMCSKVEKVATMARLAVKNHKCVVIGLQSTGESVLKEAIDSGAISFENGGSELPSVAEAVLLRACDLLKNTEFEGDAVARAAVCERLREDVSAIGLPPNALDDIIDRCGGPSVVAEMTGRSMRLIRDNGQGEFRLEKRSRSDGKVNIIERDRFQSGAKLIGVISDAASTGVSLHASRTVENQRRRLHITLQLPWAADKAVQQFGRTHRSNQVNAPQYVLLMSDVGGESRFATAVASRMKKLGALTKGDRRAASTGQKGGVEDFDIDDAIGKKALIQLLSDLERLESGRKIDITPTFLEADDINLGMDLRKAREFGKAALAAMRTAGLLKPFPAQLQWNRSGSAKADANFFLNRLFMIPLQMQNQLYSFFELTVARIKNDLKRTGGISEGIVDVAGDNFEVESRDIIALDPDTRAKTELITYTSDRGVSWDDAYERYKESYDEDRKSAFFLKGRQPPFGYQGTAVRRYALAIQIGKSSSSRLYKVIKPASGHESGTKSREDLKLKWQLLLHTKESINEVQDQWTAHYEEAADKCGHKNCTNADCTYGLRKKKRYVVSGACLSMWETLLNAMGEAWMSIVRFTVAFEGGRTERIVGVEVRDSFIERILAKVDTEKNERTYTDHLAATTMKFESAKKDPFQALWLEPAEIKPPLPENAHFRDPSRKEKRSDRSRRSKIADREETAMRTQSAFEGVDAFFQPLAVLPRSTEEYSRPAKRQSTVLSIGKAITNVRSQEQHKSEDALELVELMDDDVDIFDVEDRKIVADHEMQGVDEGSLLIREEGETTDNISGTMQIDESVPPAPESPDEDSWADVEVEDGVVVATSVSNAVALDTSSEHSIEKPNFFLRVVWGPFHDLLPKIDIPTNVVEFGRLHLRLCWIPSEVRLTSHPVPSPVLSPNPSLRQMPWSGGKSKKKIKQGCMFYLGTSTVIGRKDSCDIVVAHKCISGKHVTVAHTGFTGPKVTNHSSQDNVFVGSQCVRSGKSYGLSNGDVVSIGGASAEKSLYDFLVKYNPPPLNTGRLCLIDGPKVDMYDRDPILPTSSTVVLFHDPSGQISREHARIKFSESSYTWTIADTGSDGKGTLNGVQLGATVSSLRVITPGEASAVQLNVGTRFALGGAPKTNVGVRLPKLAAHVFCVELDEEPSESQVLLSQAMIT
eukprot:m.156177 g.156177  ORF g.156177 m.156177 type:complete len:1736 (-) comp14428_c0_seq4:94-5301(-)